MNFPKCILRSLIISAFLALLITCRNQVGMMGAEQNAIEMDSLLKSAFTKSSSLLNISLDAATKVFGLAEEVHNDTMKIKSWLVMGSILSLQGKADEAFSLFQSALQLSEKIEYEHGICRSLLESGSILYIRGQYEQCADLFKKSLKIAKRRNFSDIEASALNFLGKYYHTTGRFEESVDYYQRALQIYRSKKDSLNSVTVLLNLGKTYNIDSDMYMALKCYLEAFNICRKTKDYSNISDVCSNIGSIYLMLDQTELSLEYHRTGLSYRILLNTPEGLSSSFNNIGKVYLVKNNPDSALFYFSKSLTICEQISYLKGRVKALANIGKVYNLKSEHSKARSYLHRSISLSLQSGYAAGTAEASLGLGDTFLSLHQTDSARMAFETCLVKAKSTNLVALIHDAYWGLYRCYLEKKDYEKTLEYYRYFVQADKKMLQSENNARLSELRVSFESEKKENDNVILRKENQIKEITINRESFFIYLFILALALTVFLIVMLYSRFENKRKANERLAILNKKIVKQNRELEKLNKELENANREKDKVFSIITHELRNPLYWFQNLTEMLSMKYKQMPAEKVQKTLSALDESAKNAFHLMDNLLHWSRSRLNRIKPVIAVHSLENLVLESSRMYETILKQKNIRLNILLAREAFILADADLFMCIVRNLVSNSIKFTPENGVIEITSISKNQNYIIQVSDSGIGIDPRRRKKIFTSDKESTSVGLMNEKGSGFGLRLCKEFVQMNNGRIWIVDETETGTCFCFTVPAATQKEL